MQLSLLPPERPTPSTCNKPRPSLVPENHSSIPGRPLSRMTRLRPLGGVWGLLQLERNVERQSSQRTRELWAHLGALFGFDSVKRKFGQTPPMEWDAALSQLTDAQLNHGLNSVLSSGKQHMPSLPEFIAICRSAREWVNPGKPEQQIVDDRFDRWDVAANQHFLAEVLRAMNRGTPFTPGQTLAYLPWKHAWARDCREDDKGQGVPVETQRLWWDDCMARARAQWEATA